MSFIINVCIRDCCCSTYLKEGYFASVYQDGFRCPAEQIPWELWQGKHQQKVQAFGQLHGEPRAQSGGNRPRRRQGVMGQATEPGLISAAGPSWELFGTYVSKICDLETMRQREEYWCCGT